MTTNFYAPPSAIHGSRVVLPPEETRHARSVLRVQAGDQLTVVDGEGGWYRVQVEHCGSEQVVGSIVEAKEDVGEPPVRVTVGLGLLKRRQRFETFAEKAVELGVQRIVPLRTAHTEADTLRRSRVQNVMVAALKQCRRSRLPTLARPKSLGDVLDETEAACRFICHGAQEEPTLHQVLQEKQETASVLVLVGPEGGFREEEVGVATDAGCTPVTLGTRRLRAETAGIMAVTTAVQVGRIQQRAV